MNVPAVAFMVLVVVLIAGACVVDRIGAERQRREERKARVMSQCLRTRQLDALITSPVSTPETVERSAGGEVILPRPRH